MYTTMNLNVLNKNDFDQVMGKSHDFNFCVHIFDKARIGIVVAERLQH